MCKERFGLDTGLARAGSSVPDVMDGEPPQVAVQAPSTSIVWPEAYSQVAKK